MKRLYIISGCNGAGKTTASYTVLPEMLNCKEFVNADEIAKGLSPFQPEQVSIQAGRIMLSRLKDLLAQGVDFAFETTLSSKTYRQFIHEAQANGYFVTLVYFLLNSSDLAVERVRDRVVSGGHHIPEDVVRRSYAAGLKNLHELYIPICDYWMIIDNSEHPSVVIAEGFKAEEKNIFQSIDFQKIIENEYR